MSHNGEADACDLLMEVCFLMNAAVNLMLMFRSITSPCWRSTLTTQPTSGCACTCSAVCPTPPVPATRLAMVTNLGQTEGDDTVLLKTCLSLFRKFDVWPSALHVALKLNEFDIIKDVFMSCPDKYCFEHAQSELRLALGASNVSLPSCSVDSRSCLTLKRR